MNRREFIRAGVAGGVVLTLAGRIAKADPKNGDEESAMLSAVSSAVLAGVLPQGAVLRQGAIADTVAGVRQAISGLSANAQKEVGELFSLLTFGLARRFLAGVSSPWATASDVEVAAFLESWRQSRFTLLRGAYAALHDLVLGAWYARPESWSAIGYPGTPEVMR